MKQLEMTEELKSILQYEETKDWKGQRYNTL